MKILIVDDSRTMRLIVKRTLRQAGYGDHPVEEASSGAEALQLIKSAAPDLILCDWNMPGMSGLELLQQIKADGTAVPFGFVTSESTADMHDLAKQQGALFVITKPFTSDTFRESLRPLLG